MSETLHYQGFFGAPPQVVRQLFALPQSVVQSPYFVLLLESTGKADVRVFIRATPDEDCGEVRDWQGEELGNLPERILAAGWGMPGSRRGVVEVLDGLGPFSVRVGISCPPSARGAFGHQLRRHEQEPEVRAFVIA